MLSDNFKEAMGDFHTWNLMMFEMRAHASTVNRERIARAISNVCEEAREVNGTLTMGAAVEIRYEDVAFVIDMFVRTWALNLINSTITVAESGPFVNTVEFGKAYDSILSVNVADVVAYATTCFIAAVVRGNEPQPVHCFWFPRKVS